MFRIIHPNRWFFWAVALLLVVGLALGFYIQKVNDEFQGQMVELAALGTTAWRTYSSPSDGFLFRYPPSWQVEVDRFDRHTVTFENPRNFDENITVAVTYLENEILIRESLGTVTEKKSTIDGNPAVWLRSGDSRDRATANAILVRHRGKLYVISGSARQFEKIAWSLKFIK